jgi:alkylhydroperoxidase/carboxymuconolactone decarboxylase family protein YurZ
LEDLATLLKADDLARLRAAYDAQAMAAANVGAVAGAFPWLRDWNQQIATTFYGPASALAPPDRERCLIMLLTHTGPQLPLAVHMYWGLMEGLSIEEICQVVGLAGCYGGLPKCVEGLLVMKRVLNLLAASAASGALECKDVLSRLVNELG